MSIGTKLIMTLLALGILLMVGIVAVYDLMVVPAQLNAAVDEARMTAVLVQHVSPYLTHQQMQSLLEHLAKSHTQIQQLMILDTNGKVVESSDPASLGKQVGDPLVLSAARSGKTVILTLPRSQQNGNYMRILTPEYDAKGRRVGEIEVASPVGRLRANLVAYHAAAAIVLLLIGLIFMGLAIWTFRNVIRPIRQIDAATRQMDEGSLDVRLPADRRDEIGSLMSHFNSMAGTMASLVSDLRRKSVELQEYIDHLTTLNGKLAPDGTMLALNATAANFVGVPTEDLIGLKLWDGPWWEQSDEMQNRLKDAVRRAALGTEVRFETINLSVDDSRRLVDISLKPVAGEDGKVAYIVAEGRDITQRKYAEEALSESERRLASIVDFLPDATFAIDMEGRVTLWNREMEKLTGVRAEDILGKGDKQYSLAFYGDRRPLLIDIVFAAGREDAQHYLHFGEENGVLVAEWFAPHLGTEGMTLWAKASALYGPEGEPVGAIEIIRDITERKRAEEALRESEERTRALSEATFEGIALSEGGALLRVNKQLADMLGYQPEEMAGMSVSDFVVPEDRERVTERVRQERIEGFIEHGAQRKDGSRLAVEARARMILYQGRHVRVTAIRDITERKRAEQALRESEEKYRSIIENAPVGFFQSSVEGRLLSVNPALARIGGFESPAEMVEVVSNIGEELYVDPEKRREIIRGLRQSRDFGRFEIEFRRQDGSVVTANLYARLVYDDGNIKYLEGFIEDITERRGAIKALRESEQRLRLLVEQTPLGVIGWDQDSRVVRWNPAAEKIFGYSAEEAIGRHANFIIPFTEKETTDRIWEELYSGTGGARSTNENVTRDGRIILCEWYNAALTTEDGTMIGVASLVQDVTERRRIDEEKRAFYRETIRSATQGRLNLVSHQELKRFEDNATWSGDIGSPESIARARHGIEEFCESHGFGGERLGLFLTGAGEAMTNAIKHAGEGTVRAGVEPGCVWVMISDRGAGIGALTLPKATLFRGFSSKVSMGMGYSIMLEVADSIWLATGAEGTTVVLVLDREATPAEMSLDDLPDIWNEIPDVSM